MSKTRRAHEPLSKLKAKGGKAPPEDGDPRPPFKTHKQRRPNERTALRKEYLR